MSQSKGNADSTSHATLEVATWPNNIELPAHAEREYMLPAGQRQRIERYRAERQYELSAAERQCIERQRQRIELPAEWQYELRQCLERERQRIERYRIELPAGQRQHIGLPAHDEREYNEPAGQPGWLATQGSPQTTTE